MIVQNDFQFKVVVLYSIGTHTHTRGLSVRHSLDLSYLTGNALGNSTKTAGGSKTSLGMRRIC